MPKQDTFQLHPYGWEGDPEEERFKVSTLDYLAACTYNSYAVFFRLQDEGKSDAATVLKAGLERTLSQARHLCGTIEKDPEGGHSFVKTRDSTVQFDVQWLDSSEDDYPSFDELERSSFSAVSMGDLNLWSVSPMTYGEKPEALPDNHPVVSAFKANFVRGGLVFNMHNHHYANDVLGWASFTHQLSENCRALYNQAQFPSWNKANLDLARFTKEEPAEKDKVEGPPQAERHPDNTTGVALLFHLPKSKAAELKKQAMPTDGSWVSTYDAFSAFIWRALTRLRLPIFNADLDSKPFWSEAVDMRRRLRNPTSPSRIQRNVMSAALSTTSPVVAPTIAQVVSQWSLCQLASYIRHVTDSVTQENLDAALETVSKLRDKSGMSIRIDSYPPMSILQTDHRDADITSADFGFARPVTYRHPINRVTNGIILIYPTRDPSPESDEGVEILICYEKRLAQTLIEDPEWNEYFQFRGVDAEDATG